MGQTEEMQCLLLHKVVRDVRYYHCSPTLVPWRFRPRLPRKLGVKRHGSNGDKSIVELLPSRISSDSASPQAGAQAIPLGSRAVDAECQLTWSNGFPNKMTIVL